MSEASEVGFVYDDRYLQHNPGIELFWTPRGPRSAPFVEPILHPSNYRLAMRTKHLLDLGGLTSRLVRIEPRPATAEELALFHTPEYVARVRQLSAQGGGDAGEHAPVGPGSYEIALLAAGGAIAAVGAVMEGAVRRVFVNCRPPGHHALADRGMGYCLFNNVVLAARHARNAYGIGRVLILDWDVHHGNGTQEAFYADPSVLFVSLHQDGLYPHDMGPLHQTGSGAGDGTTVNLPLPAGSGDAVYRAAFERIVLPIARAFAPELILVSAGQDASTMDPEGRMCLSSEAYRWMTAALMDLAAEYCQGRLVLLQEGGYSELYAPYCALGIVESLSGIRTHLPEPLDPGVLQKRPEIAAVGPGAEAALKEIQAAQAVFWPALRGR
ncbi:MAG TPA: class II histone deacetylase [Methylococcaceae bacterium]|nr:class II histone deacetylase [Methylococcaceae bacterium]